MTLPSWTIDTGSSATSYKVTGLNPSKQYSFTVTPKNAVGSGPASTAVDATMQPQASSSTPTIVTGQYAKFRVDATGATSITLSLPNPPQSGNTVFVFANMHASSAGTVTAPSSATLLYGPVAPGTTAEAFYIWKILGDQSNSYTFSGGFDGTDYSGWKIIEVANVASYDFTSGTATENSTTSVSWTPSTPTTTSCIRLSDISFNNAPATITTGNSGVTVLLADVAADDFHAGFLASVPGANTGAQTVNITGGNGQTADTPAFACINLYGASLPVAVTAASSLVTSSSAKITWNLLSDPTVSAYTVQYEGGGLSSYTEIVPPLPATSNNITISGLIPSTSYNFQVFASNATGDGPVSNTVSITTLAQSSIAVVQAATPGTATTSGSTIVTVTATFPSNTTVGNTIAFFVTGYGDTNNLAAAQPTGSSNWSGILNDNTGASQSICAFWTIPVTTAKTSYSFAEFDDQISLHAIEIAGVTSVGSIAHAVMTTVDGTGGHATLPITAPTSTPAFGLYLLNFTNTVDSFGSMPSNITMLSQSTGNSSSLVTYHQGAVVEASSAVATGNQTIPYSLANGTQVSPATYVGVNFYGSAAATPPGQVTGLAAGTATASTQALTWSAASGTVTSYTVQYTTHGGSTWTTASNSVSGTSYTVTGLASGTSYDYRVIAYNNTTAGTASAIVTNSTLSSTPGQSSITLGSATTTTQPLSWTVPTGTVTSYTIQYKAATASSYSLWASGLVTTSTTVTGLTPATSYNYQVIAYNGTTAGPTSNAATGSTAALSTPGQPSGVTLGTPTSNSQPISWTASSGTVTTYTVQYSSASSSGPWTTLPGITSTSTTVSSLIPSTVYYYQVFALNGSSMSAGSTVVNGSTASASPPGQVTGLTAGTTTSSSIMFSWTVPSGSPNSYTLAWKPTAGSSFTQVTGIGTNSYTLTGLSPQTSYTVQVTALAYGVAGTSSSTVVASTSATGGGTGTNLVTINGKLLVVEGKIVLA